jgi:hypothetical protein
MRDGRKEHGRKKRQDDKKPQCTRFASQMEKGDAARGFSAKERGRDQKRCMMVKIRTRVSNGVGC